MTAAVN